MMKRDERYRASSQQEQAINFQPWLLDCYDTSKGAVRSGLKKDGVQERRALGTIVKNKMVCCGNDQTGPCGE